MNYCFGNIRIWSRRILLSFCWSSIFFWYFNHYYLKNGGSGTYKPYHFLKEYNENFQIHVCKCFNRHRFLAEISIKLQKMHFLDNWKPIAHNIFSSTYFCSNCFYHLFLHLRMVKIYFHVVPPLVHSGL